jgi:hypothetical protein
MPHGMEGNNLFGIMDLPFGGGDFEVDRDLNVLNRKYELPIALDGTNRLFIAGSDDTEKCDD